MKKLLSFVLLACLGVNAQTLVLHNGKKGSNQEFRPGPAGLMIENLDGSFTQIGQDLIGGTTLSGLPPGVANGSQLVSNGPGAQGVYQAKPIADVADYPLVIGDGSTDVCTSFQAFIDANPGKHLLARKTGAPSQGGGGANSLDYYSSCTFHLKYNGTWLDAPVNNNWSGAVNFLFAAGVTGFQIDPSCSGCRISNIAEIGGGKPVNNAAACYNTSTPLVYPFTGATDGFLVYGGEPTLDQVQANCNARDGIHIDGSNINIGGFIGQPDGWQVNGGISNQNLHDNLYIHGGDSNAGYEYKLLTYFSGGWGVEDDASLGNTHVASFTTGDGRDVGAAAKATSNISSISCSSFTCSVVAATPVASIQNGIWIVIAGTTNYNGVYYVTSFTDTTHFSYVTVAASVATENAGTVGVDGSTHMFANAIRSVSDAACPSGQAVLTSQSAQFGIDTQAGATINVAGAGAAGALLTTTISSVVNEYSVNLAVNCSTAVTNTQASYGGGISHGPIFDKNQGVTWVGPYWESNQPTAKIASGNTVVGGNMSINWTFGSPLYLHGQFLDVQTFSQRALSDVSNGGMNVNCGSTVNVGSCFLQLQNYNGSYSWLLNGPWSTANEFQIKDGSSGGQAVFQAVDGGDTSILPAQASAGNINLFGTSQAAHITFERGGGMLQGSTTAPAVSVNTSGSDVEDLYTSGANCSAIGSTASLTALPGSFIAQFCKTTGISTPLQFTSTLATGTPPFSVASTTNVANLNASSLNGATFAAPGPIGSTTPSTGSFTTLLASGIIDGKAPVTITTGTSANLGTTYSSGYTLNQEATAGTGVTYTLPATVTGAQYCVHNSGTTGVVNTGVLTVYPPSGSFVILNGVVNTVGGGGTHGVASGGAAADSACFVAIDSTHWEVFVGKGTWTEN